MALRITQSLLLSGTALDGALRVTQHALISAIPLGSSKKLTAHQLITAAGAHQNDIITAHYLVSAVSIHSMFSPNLLESGVIYGIEKFTYELAAQPMPEHNPYRPRIPEQLISHGDDFYDFFEENQQIIREQHNLTQAGDSTFPYQLIMDTHTDKHYKLGSVGRFFKEEYGIFQCRYVQFANMVEVATPHCPVGLFATKVADALEWRVTNDLSKSHPDLVVGICAPFVLPDNEKYGWVIVDGPILQQVKNDSETQAIGEAFAWSATGSVSNDAPGKIIGRRVNKTKNDLSLRAGFMWVRTESLSETSLRAIIDDQTKELQDAVSSLQDSIADLPAAEELNALNNLLEALQQSLALEISSRKSIDAAIQQQLADLDAISQADLDTIVTNTANALAAAVSNLQSQIDAIQVTANLALEKAIQALNLNLQPLQDQINTILAFMNAEKARAKGRFPVVDGSVPPNLVYMDDGSLVYVETF